MQDHLFQHQLQHAGVQIQASTCLGKPTYCPLHSLSSFHLHQTACESPDQPAARRRGESERMVRCLFEIARAMAPSTIFIDEVDRYTLGPPSLLRTRCTHP